MIFYRIAWMILKPLVHLFYWMRAEGLENVPKKGPVIIAAKHSAAADPIFYALCQWRVVRSMAKSELFKGWFMNAVMRLAGAFPVRRGKADKSAVEMAADLLKSGQAVLIFPEGTRTRLGVGEFKTGAVSLAALTKAPIVPATIVTERGYRPFCGVTVRYGKPVTAEQLDVRHANSNSIKAGTEKLREMVMGLAQRERGE